MSEAEKTLEVPQSLVLEILDVLRLTPVYTLLNSDAEVKLGYDFKPWKWRGYEEKHAEAASQAHRRLQDLAMKEMEDERLGT